MYLDLYDPRFSTDYLFTNTTMIDLRYLRTVRPKRTLYVPHRDAVTRSNRNEKSDIGVFLGQYLPFHKEFQNKNDIYLDPKLYYRELENYFANVKQRFNLSKVILARHPNSQGEELSYLDEYESKLHKTEELISKSKIAFTHFSLSSAMAMQLNVRLILVHFEEVFNEKVKNMILKKSKDLSVDFEIKNSENIENIKSSSIKHSLKKCAYKKFFKKKAPTVVDYVRRV
jgi:hypothetical protein